MNTARLDLSDPGIKDALASVRSDTTDSTYCILGYEGKAKIVCKKLGEGSPFAAVDEMDDAEVLHHKSFAFLAAQRRHSQPTHFLNRASRLRRPTRRRVTRALYPLR